MKKKVIEGKRCTKCDEYKLFTEFQRRNDAVSDSHDGYRAQCKPCTTKRRRELRSGATRLNDHSNRRPILGIKVPMSDIEADRRRRAAEAMW